LSFRFQRRILSWREYPNQQRPAGVKDRGGCGLLILLAVILWIIGADWRRSGRQRPDKRQRRKSKKQRGLFLRQRAAKSPPIERLDSRKRVAPRAKELGRTRSVAEETGGSIFEAAERIVKFPAASSRYSERGSRGVRGSLGGVNLRALVCLREEHFVAEIVSARGFPLFC